MSLTASRIDRLVAKLGSVREVSLALDVSEVSVYAYKSGRAEPRAEIAEKIAALLGAPAPTNAPTVTPPKTKAPQTRAQKAKTKNAQNGARHRSGNGAAPPGLAAVRANVQARIAKYQGLLKSLDEMAAEHPELFT